MKDTIANFLPTIAGGSGAGLLAITPGDIQNSGQLIIVLVTVITQLISIFKKKKPNAQETK